jgi:hypothetical protein
MATWRQTELEAQAFCSLARHWHQRSHVHTDHSRAEKLWLVRGVMGDVMPCYRERERETPSQEWYATIHSEKNYEPHNSLLLQTSISSSCVFAMNNKASPPSTNPTKKCTALLPYFPSLESRLAGEHTVITGLCRNLLFKWKRIPPKRSLILCTPLWPSCLCSAIECFVAGQLQHIYLSYHLPFKALW